MLLSNSGCPQSLAPMPPRAGCAVVVVVMVMVGEAGVLVLVLVLVLSAYRPCCSCDCTVTESPGGLEPNMRYLALSP